MPLQATSGAASYDAFGGGVPAVPNYIEEVFSTYLYKGNDSTQTITNGIDLSTKGGLVWIKSRNQTYSHILSDTNRGTGKFLSSNTTDAQGTDAQDVTAFNTTGFTVGNNSRVNNSSFNYVGWTFRKQPKFFDVVTYTGNGSNRTIAHALGSVPGCIIVKRTDTSASWSVYHRSLANTQYLTLNTNDDASTDTTTWNSTTATSTVFSLGTDTRVNASGGTYVAYIFAHDAGGFGLTGTDNVISCGSFTTGTGFGAFNVNLGWEPQWVLIKRTDGFRDWVIYDTMRGFNTRNLTGDADAPALYPNLSSAEDLNGYVGPYATGFSSVYTGTASANYIYIAIRRGPMKVPTSGTSVFATNTLNTTTPGFVSNFVVDMSTYRARSGSDWYLQSRITAGSLYTNTSDAENALGNLGGIDRFPHQTGWRDGGGPSTDLYSYMFKRAPNFFDVVICKQTGSAQDVTHNLGVAPELLILKDRTSAVSWQVGTQFTSTTWNNLVLNITDAGSVGAYNNYINAQPTSTVFRLGPNLGSVNDSFVAYLFATCAGVSKVGSYTGTATTLQIDCGFTGGARFVLIKRTDSTGAWYVWDTVRGIVSGNDPYLLLNSTAAEVTSTDYIDTYSAGFEISSTAPAAINASGGTFIFLAIA